MRNLSGIHSTWVITNTPLFFLDRFYLHLVPALWTPVNSLPWGKDASSIHTATTLILLVIYSAPFSGPRLLSRKSGSKNCRICCYTQHMPQEILPIVWWPMFTDPDIAAQQRSTEKAGSRSAFPQGNPHLSWPILLQLRSHFYSCCIALKCTARLCQASSQSPCSNLTFTLC